MSTKQTNSKEIRASKQPNVQPQQPQQPPVALTALGAESIAIIQRMATSDAVFRQKLDEVLSTETRKIEEARALLSNYNLLEEAPATRRNVPVRKQANASGQKAANQGQQAQQQTNRAGRPTTPETKAMGEKAFTYIRNNPGRSAGEICAAVGFEKSKWNSIRSYLSDRIVMTGERRDARYTVA